MDHHEAIERVYHLLVDEDDEQVSGDLREEAREAPRRNFLLNALNGAATKLAEQLASPGLVLPWFLDALGAPAAVIGFLVPVRRSGALLPQLVVAGHIRQEPIRKWYWIAGGLFFGLALLLMIPAARLFSGLTAGVLVLILLALGSLARGVSSVAFKDVLAKTIPQGQRGTLLAVRATAGGLLAFVSGLLLRGRVAEAGDQTPYLYLVGLAGGLWLLGVSLIAGIREEPGATGERRNVLQEARAGWRLLLEVSGFRRFVLARSALLGVELSLPYFALYARRLTDGGSGELGVFVMAASLAQVLSSPVWGRLSDRTSRWVMVWSAGLAAVGGVLALMIGAAPTLSENPYALAVPVLLVGFAISGVRLGRKTYLVDGAPSLERPLYAALSNTVVGTLTLLGGGLGLVAEAFGVRSLLAALTAIALLGALASWWLPEAERMSDRNPSSPFEREGN